MALLAAATTAPEWASDNNFAMCYKCNDAFTFVNRVSTQVTCLIACFLTTFLSVSYDRGIIAGVAVRSQHDALRFILVPFTRFGVL